MALAPSIIFLAVTKKNPEEYYLLSLTDTPENYTLALRKLGQWASNPELSFNWEDAVFLSGRLRELSRRRQPRFPR
jgi:hypothetical protein